MQPANAFIQMTQPGAFFVLQKSYIDNTDLFIVERDEQERIYALKGKNGKENGYKLIRVDRDIKKYISSGILGKNFDEYKITWDNVENSKDIAVFNTFRDGPKIKGKGNNIDVLINSLSEKHRNNLYDGLYKAGDDKSDIQEIWNVVKHLIPFYDCVEGIINNNAEQAAPSCLLDAVAFIPFFGQATNLSGKFGISFAQGVNIGITAARKGAIKTAGRSMLGQIRLPTAAELASLGKNAFRATDPGLDILTGLSRQFGRKVVKLLSADINTAELAKSIISTKLLKRLPQAPVDKPVMARLKGTHLQMPVKKIGKNAGTDIYAFVNPENGYIGGAKLFRNEVGELDIFSPKNKKSPTPRHKTEKVSAGIKNDEGMLTSEIAECNRFKRGANLGKLCSGSTNAAADTTFDAGKIPPDFTIVDIKGSETRPVHGPFNLDKRFAANRWVTNKVPIIVYRQDNRSLDEIISAGGFYRQKQTLGTLEDHMLGSRKEYSYVSTSIKRLKAGSYGKYEYALYLKPHQGIDAAATLQATHGIASKSVEFAVPGIVTVEQIKGWRKCN